MRRWFFIQNNAMQPVWRRAAVSLFIPIVNSAVMAMLLLQSELTRIFYSGIAKYFLLQETSQMSWCPDVQSDQKVFA